ncbi:aminotransferase class I/II [Polaribacter sp. ALD11]|uniref:aminotransferase class I/II-fold pyridoxal phosphate-dependent enzyme n=1 Tax=Polaribacter sp. ALD11 TaxID=2058137 RepID=UPI000C30EFB9|nr:aminotransferase class I/II-fold pyridoxal phosphate-dependent enzyme [Polaribacter sp. ALD11]AUC86026.1 aminotransferase class I/II [Polaribacter sp. ALD11]
MQLDKAPNTTAFTNGIEYLYFSGTSYLGVTALPEFHEVIFKNIKNWGSAFGSSRNANIKLSIYKTAEEYLTNFFKTEDCVTVSSGTFAGFLTLSTLENIVDSFFYMPKTHPAILPKNALPVFEDKRLNNLLLNTEKETICIVVDAIAALETKPFNFDFLQEISSEKKVILLVDESHSLGVLGENGNGISSKIKPNENIEVISVSSLGKAFGVNGGIIAGKENIINLIKENPLFIGSAPMNPAFLASFLNAQELYKSQFLKLQENCKYVYEQLKDLKKITISENYPVFYVNDEKIAKFLASEKIIITSFYYPTSIKKINRIVLNANHTKEQLDFLIKLIKP